MKGGCDTVGKAGDVLNTITQTKVTPDCDALKSLDPTKIFNIEGTIKGLKPKFAGDIKGLKNQATGTFKTTVNIIKTIINYCKKIFYIATLLFMMYDGYK